MRSLIFRLLLGNFALPIPRHAHAQQAGDKYKTNQTFFHGWFPFRIPSPRSQRNLPQDNAARNAAFDECCYLLYEYGVSDLLPLDGARRFAGDVVDDAVDAVDFVDDTVGKGL